MPVCCEKSVIFKVFPMSETAIRVNMKVSTIIFYYTLCLDSRSAVLYNYSGLSAVSQRDQLMWDIRLSGPVVC